MSVKKFFIGCLLFIISINTVILILFNHHHVDKLNMANVNDIVQSVTEQWDTLDSKELPGLNYGLDYVVIDENNQVIATTRSGLSTSLNLAISNRDTIVDIIKDGKVVGKLLIYNDTAEDLKQYKTFLQLISMVSISLVAFLSLFYAYYLKTRILNPFQKLKNFAKEVALGNLDLPLEMDKGNHFGAFTESFDLMREELKKARENERRANQSKKELVASLSHDIKTPVASIKAVSEILSVKTNDDYIVKQLDVIDSKADQINTLITNMFNATLEELQELKVEVIEESSQIIYDLIKESDYNKQVSFLNKEGCIVLMDPLRLSQVIDNIISNSYKYANTSIQVSMNIKGKYLEVSFKDFGLGVKEDELPLLFNKFYRGQNGSGKSGTGLGLYISRYLMNEMQGDITCKNDEDGFMITIKCLIA